jgi:hypothetical protein
LTDPSPAVAALGASPRMGGQNWMCLSMIGPLARQKHRTYGLKVYSFGDSREDAEKQAEMHRQRERYFDVYVADVGEWLPLDFSEDEIKDQRYSDAALTELIQGKRQAGEEADAQWEKNLEARREAVKKDLSREGQAERLNSKEPAVSVRYKIAQYEATMRAHKRELEALYRLYHTAYTEAEREEAESIDMPPVPEPGQLQLALYE